MDGHARTANARRVRDARGELKAAVQGGTVDWVDCLLGREPEQHALSMAHVRAGDFLTFVNGLGEQLRWEILVAAGPINPKAKLADVGRASRVHIARLCLLSLNPSDPRLGKINAEPLPALETADGAGEVQQHIERHHGGEHSGGPKLQPGVGEPIPHVLTRRMVMDDLEIHCSCGWEHIGGDADAIEEAAAWHLVDALEAAVDASSGPPPASTFER